MNKIQQMIEELCPEGVEYVKLGEVADVGTGSSNGKDADDGGTYPFFVRSQIVKQKNTYEYDEEAIIIPGEGGVGDIFHYIKGKYAIHQRVYRIHILEENINTKFIFYYMKSYFKRFIMKYAVSATVTSIRKPMIEKFLIPLPPLPIQSEIVKILDKFSALQAELEAKLEAELVYRKRQYEYYRDRLIAGDAPPSAEGASLPHKDCKTPIADDIDKHDSSAPCSNIKWMKMGEVAYIPNERVSLDYIDIYIGVENLMKDKAGALMNTTMPQAESAIAFKEGDILIGNIRPYLRKLWHATCDGGTNGDVVLIRLNDEMKSQINLRYLYHTLASESFFEYDNKWAKGAKMPRGNKSKILEFPICVPPLSEQARIADILDRFEALTTSISEGLPAEIAARRQQYEYYRDKLLTFKRRAS